MFNITPVSNDSYDNFYINLDLYSEIINNPVLTLEF